MAVDEQHDEAPDLLSIGQLAEQAGVARTALRYYDEFGLVRPLKRVSGQRRYARSAIKDVVVLCFLREVGFSLSEIESFLGTGERQLRNQIIACKIAELAEQQRRLYAARTALEHGLRCPADEPAQCPRFWSIIESHRGGMSLEESHNRAHPAAHPAPPGGGVVHAQS